MQKSKIRHNKKRNTAFLYESLAKELTKAIVEKNEAKTNKIVSICKKFFNSKTALHKELELYNVLRENTDLDSRTAERLIQETVNLHSHLNEEDIFTEQTALINTINKELSPTVFNNFIPDYKSLATIYQMFNKTAPIKERILLEQTVLQTLTSKSEIVESNKLQPIDDIVYKTFANKFNEKYNGSLLAEQKELISKYIMSGADDGISLKLYLNEEIGRLKSKINEVLHTEEFKQNGFLADKTSKLSEKLDSFKQRPVDHQMLTDVLKIQNFIQEATK